MRLKLLITCLGSAVALSACATHPVRSSSVRILDQNASVPSGCKAQGDIEASSTQDRASNAYDALRLDLRQNTAYRYDANTVHINQVAVTPEGLRAQGTAYKCPNHSQQ